jgi:hypothetical protein
MEGCQTWDASCATGSARFNSNTSRGACSRSAAPTVPPALTTDGAPADGDSALGFYAAVLSHILLDIISQATLGQESWA